MNRISDVAAVAAVAAAFCGALAVSASASAGAGAGAAAGAGAGLEPIGHVVLVRGEVTVQRESAAAPLSLGDGVNKGDTVRTGRDGLVQMLLNDKSLLVLSAGSQLTLGPKRVGDTRPSSVRVTIGKLWARINAKGAGEDGFTVDGTNAVAGVRGTSFFFEVDENGQTRITVALGSVHVRDVTGGENLLGPRQQSTAAAGGQSVKSGLSDADFAALVKGFSANPRLDPTGRARREAALAASLPVRPRLPQSFVGAKLQLQPTLDLEAADTTRVEGRLEVH